MHEGKYSVLAQAVNKNKKI